MGGRAQRARYFSLSTEIRRRFGRNPSRTVDWWDPIVGGRYTYPFRDDLSFDLRGDIGGFGVGSDLAWQLYPYVKWQFGERASLQAGFRWLSADYEEGSGLNQFLYDVVSEGAQVGVTLRFWVHARRHREHAN